MASWIQIEHTLHHTQHQVQGENKWRYQSQLRADMSTEDKLVDRHPNWQLHVLHMFKLAPAQAALVHPENSTPFVTWGPSQ